MINRILFSSLMIILAGSACSPLPKETTSQTTPIQTGVMKIWTATPLAGAEITSTMVATNTIAADTIATDTPTPTPIPPPNVEAPLPLTKLLTDLKVVSIDTFDTANKNDWTMTSRPSIENGTLVLRSDKTVEWGDNISSAKIFEGNEGALFKFNFSSTSIKDFQIYFENEKYGTPEYKHLGLGYHKGNMFIGSYRTRFVTYPFAGFSLKSKRWYEAAIVIDKNAIFLIYVWNPENPKEHYQFKSVISSKWAGLSWKFVADMNGEGEILFDDFSKITFSKLK